ncbi:MAG: site-specific integrase [Deltaproteobacteria bacterium]|nr:site-specific integrase [Deltaproteobacteria bacterium]
MSQLRQKMIRAMQLREFAPKTQEAYVAAVSGLAKYCNKSPGKIVQEEVENYLLHLRQDLKRSSSTCNVVISGLRFFYEHTIKNESVKLRLPPRKKTKRLPEVLSREDVNRVISSPTNIKHRVMLMTAYSAGLRVSELVGLGQKHIDSSRMVIRVEQGKGKKDRYTILSQRLLKELRVYYKACRPENWLFPAKNSIRHISISSVQKIYYRAKKKADITKGKGIHTLRHCFASHLLEAGYDVRRIQILMGHRSLSTTMAYLHVSSKGLGMVKSPFDFVDEEKQTTSPWEDTDDTDK